MGIMDCLGIKNVHCSPGKPAKTAGIRYASDRPTCNWRYRIQQCPRLHPFLGKIKKNRLFRSSWLVRPAMPSSTGTRSPTFCRIRRLGGPEWEVTRSRAGQRARRVRGLQASPSTAVTTGRKVSQKVGNLEAGPSPVGSNAVVVDGELEMLVAAVDVILAMRLGHGSRNRESARANACPRRRMTFKYRHRATSSPWIVWRVDRWTWLHPPTGFSIVSLPPRGSRRP